MNIKKNKSKYIIIFLGTLLVVVILMIATGNESGKSSSISNGVDIPVMPTKETEEVEEDKTSMKAIILEIDTNNLNILLQEAGTTVRKTYTYTGGTDIVNRYDEILSVSQLKIGEVVDVNFSASKKLSRIKVSDKEWEYQGVTNFSIDTENNTLTVGSDKYSYTDNTVIIGEDKLTSMDKLDSIDEVILKGRDKQIDSIIVTKGHGYVRLDSTTYFEGGFVEIGSKIVQLITKNMVIPVPEGDYTLMVTKDKTSGSKEITVGLNEEIRVNLTEFQSDAVRLGALSFKITPSEAILTIDGVVKNYSELIDVAYGTHKIVISADGYDVYSQIITVEDIYKEYNITLSESTETSATDSDKEETTTKKSTSATATATTETTTTRQTIDYSSLIDSIFGN